MTPTVAERRNARQKAALVALSLGAAALSCAAPAAAQRPAGNQGDTWAAIATLPHWSGAWVVPFSAFFAENARQRTPGDPVAPPLTPASAAVVARQRPGNPARLPNNQERCLPNGMPNVMRYAFAIEFLFTPGRVTILLEQDSMIRRVYTDGRGHAPDPEPSYAGDSVGHWEGDTLVVETTAISPRAELMAGLPTSGHARVTERIFLKDADHLQIDSVVEDPVALLGPWRRTRVYERTTSGFFERVCLDNQRDVDGGEPDLTPPPVSAPPPAVKGAASPGSRVPRHPPNSVSSSRSRNGK